MSGRSVPGKTDDRLRKRVREALSYFAAFAAVCGVILGIYEYRQRQALTRADNTMSQIEYWESKNGARASYRALNREILVFFKEEVGEKQVQKAMEDARRAANLRRETLKYIMAKDSAPDHFDNVVYFFSRLSLCVESKLCDEYASKIFFEDTLLSFLSIFGPAIVAEAEARPGYGEAVFDLKDKFEKTPRRRRQPPAEGT